MKNIKMESVKELAAEVTKINKYISVWDRTVELFSNYEDRKDTSEIESALDGYIRNSIYIINDMLVDMFYDWSGITAIKDEGLSPWDDTCDTYYEREDAIRDEHESVAGVCKYMKCMADDIYETMDVVPIDFMQAFIAEFGMFEVDNNNNVLIK